MQPKLRGNDTRLLSQRESGWFFLVCWLLLGFLIDYFFFLLTYMFIIWDFIYSAVFLHASANNL